MFTVLIAALAGVAAALALGLMHVFGWGWSVFCGVAVFGTVQVVWSLRLQKQVKIAMGRVQEILLAGQKQLQAKVARWQMRPPGSIQSAQAELARDQRVFVKEALAATEELHRFDRWVPLMTRQIATAQLQLYWMIKDFKAVDKLMPKALFLDPTMGAMKLARLQMRGAPIEEIGKAYAKMVARVRYNQNVLPAAAYAWILVKRNDIDGAFKALNRALEKSDNPVLKANRDHLANNRVTHFSNAGLGEQWYALQLEEPKFSQPRPRMQWR